jgi:hypothetical protein
VNRLDFGQLAARSPVRYVVIMCPSDSVKPSTVARAGSSRYTAALAVTAALTPLLARLGGPLRGLSDDSAAAPAAQSTVGAQF